MAGQVIPILQKKEFNFNNGGNAHVVRKAVDVQRWAEGAILLRLHVTDIGTGSQIDVVAKTTAPSMEDPSQDFVFATAVATASVVPADLVGALKRTALSSAFGGFLEITVDGTKGAGNCKATISADLVVKGDG